MQYDSIKFNKYVNGTIKRSRGWEIEWTGAGREPRSYGCYFIKLGDGSEVFLYFVS